MTTCLLPEARSDKLPYAVESPALIGLNCKLVHIFIVSSPGRDSRDIRSLNRETGNTSLISSYSATSTAFIATSTGKRMSERNGLVYSTNLGLCCFTL